jgi:uncharacterized membrane protein
MENNNYGKKLSNKLDKLIKKQYEIDKELNKLKIEINYLIHKEGYQTKAKNDSPSESNSIPKASQPANITEQQQKIVQAPAPTPPANQPQLTPIPKKNSNLERFIGENLINKIGIAILVIGVAIGSKYAIESFNFGPVFRIVAGYFLGASLLGAAIWLKPRYHGFSAVLLSGAMAIFYFISYAAYSFYDIIPRGGTFALLLLFTLFTVFASLNYNQQIIANIGLVGAYITPFLVSSGSSSWNTLMIYIIIINSGILVLAVKKYWKSLYISAFVASYIILSSWFLTDYDYKTDFKLGMTHLTLFFIQFYATFLVYKLSNKGQFKILDIILLSANAFLYYGIGIAIITHFDENKDYSGLFTLANAIIHFIIAIIIFRQKKAEKSMFLFVSGMVLLFLTLVFPVQFDGNWVTLFWTGEALILFLAGRIYKQKTYEFSSYVLVIISFVSLIHDWMSANTDIYGSEFPHHPFINTGFLTAVLLFASYLVIYRFDQLPKYSYNEINKHGIRKLFTTLLPFMVIITAYFSISIEINNYWDLKYQLSETQIAQSSTEGGTITIFNNNIHRLEKIWTINYSILFFSLLSLILLGSKAKKPYLISIQSINFIHLALFLFLSLYQLSELRESYLSPTFPEQYTYNYSLVYVRYFCILFIVLLLYIIRYVFHRFKNKGAKTFDIVVAGSILWLLSSELLHWLDIYHAKNSYKLVLSILWGIFALSMVIWGIIKSKKHVRISAIILIGVILVKMFFYDLAKMDGLKRSILFIVLGILMLGISFLYNKYKHLMFDEPDKKNVH